MGKFDGILIASDMDGTMLDSKNRVSQENIDAVNYFKSEGGVFTVLTGRAKRGIEDFVKKFPPNAPVSCLNGGILYDSSLSNILHTEGLSDDVKKILKVIYDECPEVGIEVMVDDGILCCRDNECIKIHRDIAFHPYVEADYNSISGNIIKVLCGVDADKLPDFAKLLKSLDGAENYNFLKTYYCFYEIMSKKADKSNQFKIIRDSVEDLRVAIAVGDNDNDARMLETADFGVAVANAATKAKNAAYYIGVSNDESAVARLISDIEGGKIKF